MGCRPRARRPLPVNAVPSQPFLYTPNLRPPPPRPGHPFRTNMNAGGPRSVKRCTVAPTSPALPHAAAATRLLLSIRAPRMPRRAAPPAPLPRPPALPRPWPSHGHIHGFVPAPVARSRWPLCSPYTRTLQRRDGPAAPHTVSPPMCDPFTHPAHPASAPPPPNPSPSFRGVPSTRTRPLLPRPSPSARFFPTLFGSRTSAGRASARPGVVCPAQSCRTAAPLVSTSPHGPSRTASLCPF